MLRSGSAAASKRTRNSAVPATREQLLVENEHHKVAPVRSRHVEKVDAWLGQRSGVSLERDPTRLVGNLLC